MATTVFKLRQASRILSTLSQKKNTYFTDSHELGQVVKHDPISCSAEEAVKCIKSGVYAFLNSVLFDYSGIYIIQLFSVLSMDIVCVCIIKKTYVIIFFYYHVNYSI